jgi:glycosyltransferase involved in cell wall biosynthesis
VEDFKITIITAVYNAEATIARCIESVISQNYKNIEYIIIDGGSADNTFQIINKYENHIHIKISEPDKGMYDGVNKGIEIASGNAVGLLNADDYFADNNVVKIIAETFIKQNADITYGNLDYVNPDGKIIRKWVSGQYKKGIFSWGWMPPHPTFYCKRELFERLGLYSLEYGTAADYELMLRFMKPDNVNICYINKVLVKMQCGGMSNKNPKNRVKAWNFDLKAMRAHGIKFAFFTLIIKPLRKIKQFF